MMRARTGIPAVIPTAACALVLAGTLGCGHVNQEQFDTSLADLRAEIQEGDTRLADGQAVLDTRIAEVADRTAQLEARMAELEGELVRIEDEFNIRIDQLEDAIRFNVPIHFGFDEAEVREPDHAILDRFEGVVSEYYPGATVTVEGFTDPAGPAEYNLRLGQRRADAVRGYLVDTAGLMGERVRAVSYGEDTSRLIAPDAHGPGVPGEENRRVVLVIDHGGAPPRIISSN